MQSKFVKTAYPEDFPVGYKLPKSAIKPIQSSIAISSTSLYMIAEIVIKENIQNFYTSNTSQDSLKSLFGQL